jgi:DNA polymerase theta
VIIHLIALHDVAEHSLCDTHRGHVFDSVQDEAGRSASMIAAFCERIGYTSLELLVSHFQGRVLHGVKDDLVDLTHLKGVRGCTARLLYTAGLETIEDIADSSVDEIHAALCQGKRSNEEHGEWRKARMIKASAVQVMQVCSF